MLKVDWLDRFIFREIEMINEKQKRDFKFMYLMIEFFFIYYEDIEYLVVYFEKVCKRISFFKFFKNYMYFEECLVF